MQRVPFAGVGGEMLDFPPAFPEEDQRRPLAQHGPYDALLVRRHDQSLEEEAVAVSPRFARTLSAISYPLSATVAGTAAGAREAAGR